MRLDPKTARTISRIAAVVSVTVAIILPLGYFVLSYQNQAGALEAEAEINGRIATDIINANPAMWRFQQYKLEEFLSRRPRHGYAETRRILDTENKVIAESVDPLRAPLLTRLAELQDSGVVVGKIEISRSLRPLLLRTGLVGLLGLLLSMAVFATLKVLPLRALDRALADNVRLLEESRKAYQEVQTLQEISQAILAAPDLGTTLGKILENTLAIGSFDLGVIRLLDPGTETFESVVGRGYQDPKNIEMHRKQVRDPSGGKSFSDVMDRKVPYIEESVQQCEGLRTFKREGIQAAVMVPVRTDEVMLGVLQVGCRAPRKFSPNEIHLLETIGNQIGVAVQKARLYEETQNNLQRMRALYEIGAAINSTLDLHAVLKVLMEKIDLFLPYTAVLVWLLDRKSGQLERAACWNLDEKDWKERKLTRTPPLVEAAMETKVPVVVRDLKRDPRTIDQEFYRRQGLISYLGVPLIVKEEVLGVLVFLTREEHQFAEREVEFLSTLAGQAAIAIHNSQLHEQAKRQALELEKANKVKDEFIGFVSHELRTPLNAVIAYTIMMQDKLLGEINPEQEKTLEKVSGYSKDLLAMINSLLEVTRIEAGRVEVENHKVNLDRFFEDLRSMYDVPTGKAVVLTWDLPSDLPDIRTDSGKLRHIFQNLINNAIKFTEKGSVTVSARSCPEAKKVQFQVKDTGIGIPTEALPVIFEMFRQVNGSHGKSSGGVGLGLHIVKKFTEMLGGKIDVESEVGKGSTFTVTIPLAMD